MVNSSDFAKWMDFNKRRMSFEPFDPIPDKETEEHHVFGNKFSDITIILPKNWHRSLTSILQAAPLWVRKDPVLCALWNMHALQEFFFFLNHLLVWDIEHGTHKKDSIPSSIPNKKEK
jgi:hypothetical protein